MEETGAGPCVPLDGSDGSECVGRTLLLPMVLQRALAAKFQTVARSRHQICLNGPLRGAPIQRLGAAPQTGFAGIGRKPFQSVKACTGPALSGYLLCGAAQGGTVSGRRRRRTIAIAPPQAAPTVVVQKTEVSGPHKAFG